MKTSELQGATLDWAVAKCEGYQGNTLLNRNNPLDDGALEHLWLEDYSPSINWEQGGPIIERERIDVRYIGQTWGAARQLNEYEEPDEWFGPTPLIAAMRCYVASRLGDDVTLPDGLV